MKINFTLFSTSMTGGVRATFEIANGLSKKGHEVTVTSLEGDHSWFPLEAEVIYVKKPNFVKLINPLIKIKSEESLGFSSIGPALNYLKMGFEPDLVKPLAESTPDCDINVATWFLTVSAVYRSNKGLPFYFFQDFDELAGKHGEYYHKIFRESLYLPLRPITISSWLKDWIKENYNKDAVICGDGIEHKIFYPRKNILNDFKVPKIMGIFRGFDYKGDSDLINALNIVYEEIRDFNLIIVCSKDTFKGLVEKNNIKFNYTFFASPSDEKLAELYSSSDLFVFPSHIEGFGLPPLEAMACGTPVVTTDCLGVRDYIDNGKNALMVPIKSPESLAEAILKILKDNDLALKLKENGLKTAQKFTWNRVADIIEKTFIEALEEEK